MLFSMGSTWTDTQIDLLQTPQTLEHTTHLNAVYLGDNDNDNDTGNSHSNKAVMASEKTHSVQSVSKGTGKV